jgi:hypothetical protein
VRFKFGIPQWNCSHVITLMICHSFAESSLFPKAVAQYNTIINTMNLRFVALLLAFVASSAQNCTLCPENALPANGDLVIGYDDVLGILTCNTVAELLLEETAEDCVEFQQYGFASVCGCPGIEAGPCPGLCPDGSEIGLPDFALPVGEGITCSFFDLLAKGTSNETVCASYQQIGVAYCDCSGFVPACSGICPDGQSPPDPNLNIFGLSCGELDAFSKFIANETECGEAQQQIGAPCGCAGLKPRCSGICSNGQPPPNPSATIFGESSCGEFDTNIQYVTNATQCAEIQERLGAYCGCSTPRITTPAPITAVKPSINPPIAAVTPAPTIRRVTPAPTIRPVKPAPTILAPIALARKSAAMDLDKAIAGVFGVVVLLAAFV